MDLSTHDIFAAKALAAEGELTFFTVSPRDVMSKFYGEAEATVSAIFDVATVLQPSIIFIDEIDALLTQPKDQDGGRCLDLVRAEFLQRMVRK